VQLLDQDIDKPLNHGSHSRPQKTPSPPELVKELLTTALQAHARDAYDLKAGGEISPAAGLSSSAPSVTIT
jgi:hypothetical protein